MSGVREPSDATVSEGGATRADGSARNRRVVRSAGAAFVARGTSAAVSLVTVPLAIGYLGSERYGVLVALTSVATMFVFGDLGIGNALVNVVSEANSRGDREKGRRALTAGLGLLLTVALLFGALAFALALLVPWADVVNAHSPVAREEAAPAAAIFLLLFSLAIPLSATERVRLAFQEAHVNSIWAILGSVLSFAGVVVGIAMDVSLPILIFLMLAPTLVTAVGNGMWLLLVDRPWLRPNPSEVRRRDLRELTHVGSLFLILQVAVAVAFQSDVVVAANIVGPEAAATYAVVLRLFMFAPRLVSVGLGVLWPAYTEAIVQGDMIWVRRTLWRSLVVTVLGVGSISLVLFALQTPALDLIGRGEVHPSTGLVLGVALWAMVSSVMNCIAILLNAATAIRFQVIVAVAMAVTSISASIVLAGFIGIEGVIIGTLGSYVLVAAIPTLIYVPRLLRQIEARSRHA